MKKKVLALFVVAALAAALTACGNNSSESSKESSLEISSVETTVPSGGPEEVEAESSESSEESVPAGAVSGGWAVNDDDTVGWAPDEAKEAFDKAAQNWTGQDFTLVAYLGSQVVAGSNYMFLCKGTLVTANPVTELKVVTVYQDLQGNAEITNVADFNIGDYWDAEDPGASEQLAGGWTPATEDQPMVELPLPVEDAFEQAMQNLDGADYYPIAYLGSQLVAGTNYAVLCKQTLVTAEPVSTLCLVYIYAPLSGDAEVSNIVTLDLTQFTK